MTNNCSIFADGTTAYTTGKNITTTTVGLSHDVTAASSWADIWGMLFNAEKSEHMMICGRGLKGVAPQPSVSMAGIPIPQVKIHKHLGVIFNDTLTWSNHIDKVYERCAQRVGILRRLRRTFPSRALRRIYVGAVLPIMEYACPVWSGGPVAKLIHLHESFCRCTRENTHLSILRQRILIRRQNSPIKLSRENVHQPRIWTPNSLHFAHAVHFAHGGQNLLLSFDCRSD